ncbi:MAG: hypothetical protein J0H29_00220 [Sphingobacteriales bacterium]|nr:hypothetical protein [Sphingobacteriales bacterium]OJY92371.1 MAG: hypothetical protein BGP14_14300 [Sphingobacteriales bacterium 44-15]
MQPKKIFATIFILALIGAVSLFLIPVSRTFRADIIVNADLHITNRTLRDTSNWDKWYYDTSAGFPAFSGFQISSNRNHDIFDYTLTESSEKKKGQVQLLRSNKNNWDTKISWVEEITCRSDISKKIQLLLHPDEFRAPFLKNMVQFKNHIEKPDNVFGGLTFEKTEIPSNKIVVAYDTTDAGSMEITLNTLYRKVTNNIPENAITKPGCFLSQFEKLSDSTSTVRVCIAVEVSDETTSVKAPFELLEVDDRQAITIHTLRNYTDLSDDLSVMYEWLKKNDARPATDYWIKHDLHTELAQGPNKSGLTIIQEIYSLK